MIDFKLKYFLFEISPANLMILYYTLKNNKLHIFYQIDSKIHYKYIVKEIKHHNYRFIIIQNMNYINTFEFYGKFILLKLFYLIIYLESYSN